MTLATLMWVMIIGVIWLVVTYALLQDTDSYRRFKYFWRTAVTVICLSFWVVGLLALRIWLDPMVEKIKGVIR